MNQKRVEELFQAGGMMGLLWAQMKDVEKRFCQDMIGSPQQVIQRKLPKI